MKKLTRFTTSLTRNELKKIYGGNTNNAGNGCPNYPAACRKWCRMNGMDNGACGGINNATCYCL